MNDLHPGYKYDLNGTGIMVVATFAPEGRDLLVPAYLVKEEGEVRRYELVNFSVTPNTRTINAFEVKEAPFANKAQKDIANRIMESRGL